MKFQRIIQTVLWEPWLITPGAHFSIRTMLESKLAGRPSEDLFGNKLEVAEIRDGIGVIPIKGVMGKGFSAFEKSCGAVGTDDIEAELKEFAASNAVRAILLDVDSPGGMVGGTPELADVVDQVDDIKPVYAWVSGMAASAAYWSIAGARQIRGTKTSELGSIGVYVPWLDQTKAYDMAGLEVKLIKNDDAPYKGMGYPGTSLTKEQEAKIKEQVNEIARMFHLHVEANRPNVSSDYNLGQTFLGVKAVAAGLMDQVCTLEECLIDLNAETKLTRF